MDHWLRHRIQKIKIHGVSGWMEGLSFTFQSDVLWILSMVERRVCSVCSSRWVALQWEYFLEFNSERPHPNYFAKPNQFSFDELADYFWVVQHFALIDSHKYIDLVSVFLPLRVIRADMVGLRVLMLASMYCNSSIMKAIFRIFLLSWFVFGDSQLGLTTSLTGVVGGENSEGKTISTWMQFLSGIVYCGWMPIDGKKIHKGLTGNWTRDLLETPKGP